MPTPETKTPALPSVYAISKYHQERLCMTVGRAYGIPTVGLRFFNIFGTRQALSNPYTGVLAIFAARFSTTTRRSSTRTASSAATSSACMTSRRRAAWRWSGRRRRTRFSTSAAVQTTPSARSPSAWRGCSNKKRSSRRSSGNAALGDIRNCFADISLAREVLGYEPRVTLEEGLKELAEWLDGQTVEDRGADASRELLARGLAV